MPTPKMRDSRPGLLRQIGFFSATALVISNMVGTGIFATTGFMAGDLGSARLILLCWTVGAFFAFAGALSYSELGINFPSSGGEYVYLTHAFGPEWGFMTGWVSFFAGFSAPIATAALAFSEYLGYFFPALRQANAMVLGSGALSVRLGAGRMLALLYRGLNAVFVCGTPLEQMNGQIAIGTLSAANLFGPGVAGIFSALLALSILSTVSAEVTVGPRVYYAMAKSRAFFSAAA